MEMFLTIKLCTCAKLSSIEQIIYLKMDLALNNLQSLICHKTNKPNQTLIEVRHLRNNHVTKCTAYFSSVKSNNQTGRTVAHLRIDNVKL